MKTERLNLCETVRNAVVSAGYSSVRIVNACNSELGGLKQTATKSTLKQGQGRVTKNDFKITESETTSDTYTGKKTTPLLFIAWHDAIAKAEKIAGFELGILPVSFTVWFDKFAKAETDEKKEVTKAEQATK